MDYIFKPCDIYRLKLHPDKCKLFTTEVKFCGKIFTPKGIFQDPKKIKTLTNMPLPKNAGELQQYLCAMNWMRSSIPDFARISKPLRKKLELVAKGTTRKSKHLIKIPISMSEEDENHFRKLNDCVANTVMLSHPDQQAEYFLFTDASNEGWGSALFQIKEYDENQDIDKQKLEPLYFLSGSFEDAKHRWSLPEKEAYAIVESVQRLDYLLIRVKPFHIMTCLLYTSPSPRDS